jgi:phasin family protein
MNLNETYTAMNKAVNDNYANMRKLAELNLATWDKLVAKQMEMMTLCMDASSKHYEAVKDVKDVKDVNELVGRQTEMARECGEKFMQKNREVVELLSGTRDEYQSWVETSMGQLKDQLAEAGEVTRKATARKAA